jgi:signal transduction histidine kinase
VFRVPKTSWKDPELERLNPATMEFERTTWPADLERFRERLESHFFRLSFYRTVLPHDPLTIVFESSGPRYGEEFQDRSEDPPVWTIVQLDPAYLEKTLFPELVPKYFGKTANSEYQVSIVEGSAPPRIVYQTNPEDYAPWAHADRRASIFRMGPGGTLRSRAQRRAQAGLFSSAAAESPSSGGWELLVKHRLGSLDAAVESIRRRNLAVSSGILMVLVGGAAAAIVSAGRARTLARLQMTFIASVSHELRTPLSVIRSGCFNLSTGAVSDGGQVRDYARMMETQASRLTLLVDQVLLYARTNSGKARYVIQPLSLYEVVEQALAGIASSGRLAQISCEIAPNTPEVAADPGALTHCVQNLLSNALKYGQTPMLPIRVYCCVNQPATAVALTVEDHGPGIPASDLPHIFEAFYRGSHADVPGTGLGLNLVKQMMEQQGGSVTVDTESGVGSRFTLHIPIARTTA